jgi:hypothetical protein
MAVALLDFILFCAEVPSTAVKYSARDSLNLLFDRAVQPGQRSWHVGIYRDKCRDCVRSQCRKSLDLGRAQSSFESLLQVFRRLFLRLRETKLDGFVEFCQCGFDLTSMGVDQRNIVVNERVLRGKILRLH